MGASSPMCDLPVVRCSNIVCALRHSWGAVGGYQSASPPLSTPRPPACTFFPLMAQPPTGNCVEYPGRPASHLQVNSGPLFEGPPLPVPLGLQRVFNGLLDHLRRSVVVRAQLVLMVCGQAVALCGPLRRRPLSSPTYRHHLRQRDGERGGRRDSKTNAVLCHVVSRVCPAVYQMVSGLCQAPPPLPLANATLNSNFDANNTHCCPDKGVVRGSHTQ